MESNFNDKKLSNKAIAALLISSMVLIPSINGKALDYENKAISKSEVLNLEASGAESKVSIIESNGDLESAYVKWTGVSGASKYKVYYKGAGEADSNYKEINSELVREYSSYFRADVLGLKEGNYNIKVVPVINGTEDNSKSSVTSVLNVKSNVREGFAFSKESPNGTASGGYNEDGSVPSKAQIIYI